MKIPAEMKKLAHAHAKETANEAIKHDPPNSSSIWLSTFWSSYFRKLDELCTSP